MQLSNNHFFVAFLRRFPRALVFCIALLICFTTVFAATLDLSENSAPGSVVPKFSQSYIDQNWTSDGQNNNDKIIYNLFQETLLFKIFKIVKYVLGGVFMLFFAIYVVELIISGGNEEDVKSFRDKVVYAFIGFAIMASSEPLAYAFFIAREGGNFITNPAALQESVQIASFSIRSAVRIIQYVLGAIALLFAGTAAMRIILANADTETIKTARKTLVWAAVGLVIATLAGPIVDRMVAPTGNVDGSIVQIAQQKFQQLTPEDQHAALLAASRLVSRAEIVKYVKYFETFVAAIAVAMIFLAGAKLVMAGGNEEVTSKETKTLTWVFLGLATILLSEIFVNIFMPEGYLDAKGNIIPDKFGAVDLVITTPGTVELQSFAMQMGGVTNFIISFAGAVAVLALIVGAVFFSTAALNEEQAEKGKKIMLGAVLGILVIISAYAIVNTIFAKRPVEPDFEMNVKFGN